MVAESDLWRCLAMPALLTCLVGCENSSSKPSADPPSPVAPAITSELPVEPVTPPAAPKTEPDSPAVIAVKTVLTEIDAGRLEAFAEFLPDNYRQQLESLLQTLAAKMPAELQAQLQSIAKKTITLLERKFDLVVQAAGSPPLDDESQAKLAAALQGLSQIEDWDVGKSSAVDLEQILKGPASDLLTVWQSLSAGSGALSSQTAIRQLRLAGDVAVLSFQSPLDPEPREVEFIQVEGHWIPKSLADGWKSAIIPWQEQIGALSETEFAAAAARLSPHLLQIEGTLDQLLKAERAEELQLGWWQIQSVLLQARQELLQPGPPPRVELKLTQSPSEDELSRLLEQLVEASDQPDLAEYVTFPTTTGLTIHLSPVTDVEKFLTRLTFAKVTKHDAAARQIELELKPPGR